MKQAVRTESLQLKPMDQKKTDVRSSEGTSIDLF